MTPAAARFINAWFLWTSGGMSSLSIIMCVVTTTARPSSIGSNLIYLLPGIIHASISFGHLDAHVVIRNSHKHW